VKIYLDASAILPMIVEEEASATVDTYIAGNTEALVVSDWAGAEVASALSRLVRTRLLSQEDAEARLADFDAWRAASTDNFDLQASDMRLAQVFVRRFDLMLRAPDALHAAVCRRQDFLLLTLDHRLAAAAAELGVSARLLEPAGRAAPSRP
jgi:predicted nucleic acid-binding protein